VLALNSLENRVYEVEVDDKLSVEPPFAQGFVVVKFYRPGRWKEDALLEEHAFLKELEEYEIPAINPISFDGQTLHKEPDSGLYYCVYPKVRGRLKDELNSDEIAQVGRLIARIHNIGALSSFQSRPKFHPKNYVEAHFKTLKNHDELPQTYVGHYIKLAQQLYPHLVQAVERLEVQRIHADVHRGNILWTEQGPWVLDLDDCAVGPREQDLWLILPGRDPYDKAEREKFLDAYSSMVNHDFFLSDGLVEILRTIRMIHFNGWVALRHNDPSFQRIYSDFTSEQHWQQQVLDLKEQFSIVEETLYN
jgi:Ser/Thr protein kinase RdoA (MazF antagonist)